MNDLPQQPLLDEMVECVQEGGTVELHEPNGDVVGYVIPAGRTGDRESLGDTLDRLGQGL